MGGDEKKPQKKRKSVESLHALSHSRQDFKNKYEEMRLWFQTNMVEDHRMDVVKSIRDIVMLDLERLASMNIGNLVNLETQLVQYVLTLGELCADTTGKLNFSYVYRKYQYSGNWTGTRDEVLKSGKKLTNGELDQITEMSVFEERCLGVFLQERVDSYKHVLQTANQYIRTLQNRIAENRRQLSLRESPTYGR